MDVTLLFKAFILGIVEGLTEFLPVSSTGHLIIVSDLMGLAGEKDKVFSIVIQLGAILAIVWEYRYRFSKALRGVASDPRQQRFVRNLLVAFLPAAVTGYFLHSVIKGYLFNPVSVAVALIVGAFVIFWVEGRRAPDVRVAEVDDMTALDALKVGCAQCVSLIPGTSRAGATIIGGMLFGLSRKAATEFSFFLAVPIMVAATAHQVVTYRNLFTLADLGPFAVGMVTAFLAAWFSVRALVRYVATHDFRIFAWYRIALGAAVLIYFNA